MINEYRLYRCQQMLAARKKKDQVVLLYEWTKTGHITLDEFRVLLSAMFIRKPITEDDESSSDDARESPKD